MGTHFSTRHKLQQIEEEAEEGGNIKMPQRFARFQLPKFFANYSQCCSYEHDDSVLSSENLPFKKKSFFPYYNVIISCFTKLFLQQKVVRFKISLTKY